jgi:putative Mg2+ transporter-C (MgtC) family protein
VWLSAALGVACGLGAWKTIAVAVPLSLLLLFAVGWLEQPWKRASRQDDQGN